MSDSLREQLLKAGLVTERQARQASQQSRQQQHRQTKGPKPGNAAPPAPRDLEAQQAQARRIARDMELNRREVEKAEAKARAAEIRQLIEQHRVAPIEDAEEYFNFAVDGRIRRIAVTPALRARIVAGTLVIVGTDGHHALVAPEIAARIRERNPAAVVELSTAAAPATEGQDPYQDFVVPDDLSW